MERDFARYIPELDKIDPNPAEVAEYYNSQPAVWERARNAFTPHQRHAIRERDGNRCNFPAEHDCNGEEKLQVHHLLPQRYSKQVGIPDCDFPENALTICERSHNTLIHEDMENARKGYRFDKEAYNKAFRERDEKLKQKLIYWNPEYDRQMQVIAIRNTQLAREKGWRFPENPKKKGVIYEADPHPTQSQS